MTFASDRTFVRKKISHYSKIMNIELPKAIFYNRNLWANYLNWNEPYRKQILDGVVLGSNNDCGKRLYIDLGSNRPRKDLENTVVHELCHTLYWHRSDNRDHTPRFYHNVIEIIGGHYPPRQGIHYIKSRLLRMLT